MRGNEIDISIIVRNAILEELYEEKEIDEKTYHKMKEIFLNQETDGTNRVEPRVRKLAPCIADVHCRGLSF